MARLTKFWTTVGSAATVCLGAGLGGLQMVDFSTMLGIAVLPQLGFILFGHWPDGQLGLEHAWRILAQESGGIG